eukprot:1392640-Amorphochlora_amoeboformis.AAC.1
MADEVIVGERHSYYIIQVPRNLVKEEGETLYEAITEAGLDYVKGHGYYQLGNKRENVNASKQLVWYDGGNRDSLTGIKSNPRFNNPIPSRGMRGRP